MNHIQMYTSSRNLRDGLHRALAILIDLTHPASVGGTAPGWWEHLELDATAAERARLGQLDLEELASLLQRPDVRAMHRNLCERWGLTMPDESALSAALRRAVISGRAMRLHRGRDVYGASNFAVWNLVCAPLGAAISERYHPDIGEPVCHQRGLPESAQRRLEALMAFDTSPRGGDHNACVAWITDVLVELGFEVQALREGSRPPLLVARRPARSLAGRIALYGHYDTTPSGAAHLWTHPPKQLTEANGRLWGRGVADNKGALACRLDALCDLEQSPELIWFIQGEEETGSQTAFTHLPPLMRDLEADLWLEETGYHDHQDGTLRLLARTRGADGADAPPDSQLTALLDGQRLLASRWGIRTRTEYRGLNKDVIDGGCPFDSNLPPGARYLALGVNDSLANIHALNESVPTWTFRLHQAQLRLLFRGVDRLARGER